MSDKYDLIKNIELYPEVVEEEIEDGMYEPLALDSLPTLGVAFESIKPALQQAFKEKGSVSGIYKVTVPTEGHLALAKDGSGFLGAVLDKDNIVSGQARLNPVVCDPTLMLMAVALMNIEKKLDTIQETQQQILSFLTEKEKAESKGNLTMLMDISKNYKYNWNNSQYKNSNHIKVLDIKQKAIQKIEFSKKQIAKSLNKTVFISNDGEVKKAVSQLSSLFEDYQLAVYLYALSSFLDVMLLENFNYDFLEGIKQSINKYAMEYREQYTDCYSKIEKLSNKSIQTIMLDGLGQISVFAGEMLSKVPLVDKSGMDEGLIKTGKKIMEDKETHSYGLIKKLINKQSSLVQPFEDNLNMLQELYSKPLELLFDNNQIYVPKMIN